MMSKTNEIKQVFDEVFLEYCPEGDAIDNFDVIGTLLDIFNITEVIFRSNNIELTRENLLDFFKGKLIKNSALFREIHNILWTIKKIKEAQKEPDVFLINELLRKRCSLWSNSLQDIMNTRINREMFAANLIHKQAQNKNDKKYEYKRNLADDIFQLYQEELQKNPKLKIQEFVRDNFKLIKAKAEEQGFRFFDTDSANFQKEKEQLMKKYPKKVLNLRAFERNIINWIKKLSKK